jgi:RHS repeat-associated protein
MTATNYIWDFATDSYLMEKDDGGNTTVVYTSEPVPYGKLISQRREDATNYYHFDAQGSTRQLTDDGATVSDAYTYSAFGETVAASGTTENKHRYVGRSGYFLDDRVNAYYVRARTYNYALARWKSTDRAEFMAGDVNLYRYCENSPVEQTDPSGAVLQFGGVCSPGFVGSAAVGLASVGATIYVAHYWIGQPIARPAFTRLFYRLTDPWVNEPPPERAKCHCYCPDYRPLPFPAEPVPEQPDDPGPHPTRWSYYGYIYVAACLTLGCMCGPDPSTMPPWGKEH